MNKLIRLYILWLFCIAYAEAHPGIGIVIDSKGTVFYTDLVHVWKISPEGHRSIAVKNVHTHELYLDEYDNLYGEHEWYEGEATDKWGNYVWCLSHKGEFEKTIPDVEGFLANNTLVRDLKGNSYWAEKAGNHEILYKESIKGRKTVFTNHQFHDIRWMYFSKSDENLYVVDHLDIKKVNPSGELVLIAENLKESRAPFGGVGDRHYIFGLWTNDKNEVFIALYGAAKIIKIDADGNKSTVFKSEEGWSPLGGLFARDGSLWVMEFSKKNTVRLVKISPDGKRRVFKG